MKKILIILFFFAFVCILVNRQCLYSHSNIVDIDTVVIENTIIKHDTIIKDSIVLCTVPKLITKTVIEEIYIEADTTMQLEQAVYADSSYTAYVSGIMPKLDSLKLKLKEFHYIDTVQVYKYNYITQIKKKKWRLFLTGGYGLTTKGFAPFFGVALRKE